MSERWVRRRGACCVKDAKSIKFNGALKSPVASIHTTSIAPDNTSNSVTKKRWDVLRDGSERKMRNGSGTKKQIGD